MNDDSQLLQSYLNGSEQAFRDLVARYVNLVYSAALRHLADTAQAEDVVQTVFTALARKAGQLPRETVLGGWLYRHTCFVASQAVRTERRRLAREREAVAMNVPEENPEAVRRLIGVGRSNWLFWRLKTRSCPIESPGTPPRVS